MSGLSWSPSPCAYRRCRHQALEYHAPGIHVRLCPKHFKRLVQYLVSIEKE